MIIINLVRFVRTTWIEAHRLRDETLRRYPHLRNRSDR